MDNKFIIITAVYNAIYGEKNHIMDCLESISSQTYKNYEVVTMDDCSTDGTTEVINQYPFYKIRNAVRNHHGFKNIITAMDFLPMDKEDIYVIVDGDDKLVNDGVLEYLNNVYQDENIWFTFGQYGFLSGLNHSPCGRVSNPKTYRHESDWFTSHLKTFKKKLFDAIDRKDLKDAHGEYFKVVGDVALTYPMVEICGKKHMKFIKDVLYIYNDLHPPGEFANVYRQEVKYLRDKEQYKELANL